MTGCSRAAEHSTAEIAFPLQTQALWYKLTFSPGLQTSPLHQ